MTNIDADKYERLVSDLLWYREHYAEAMGREKELNAECERLEARNKMLAEALQEIASGCTGRVDKDDLPCRIARAAITTDGE